MKKLFTISLMLLSFAGLSQRNYMFGVVKDSASRQDMIGVHVQNINAGSVTSTNPYGKFKLPAKAGDTIVFSSVGHTTLAWVADDGWFSENEIEFLLPVNTIYLDEVVIGQFPEYERFKEQIVQTEVADTSFQVFGVAPVVVTGDPLLDERNVNNPLFAVLHPIDFVHQKVSKKAKEKRKYYAMQQKQHLVTKANLKFTREWVGESTKLEGNKLTSFMAYCRFSVGYLAETPLYMIHEDMMKLLPDFLEEYDQS